jgi:hypothetical protein
VELTWWRLVLVAAAGVLGGAANSLAGGGSLITFPALTALGVPPVSANVTNTVALVPGYLSGAWAQRDQLRTQRRRLKVVALPAILGGLVGGWLLLETTESTFERVIPWFILLAVALLAFEPRIKAAVARRIAARSKHDLESASTSDTTSDEHASRTQLAMCAVAALFGAIYGGYFGAGLGIILLALFSLVLPDSLTRVNALKQTVSVLANASAAALFVTSDEVAWAAAAALAFGATVGGAIGGKFASRVDPDVLRWVVVVIGTAVAFAFFINP